MQESKGFTPLVIIDEVQKLPALMDGIQYLIDKGIAQFILTGSSARKLRHNKNINLLNRPQKLVEGVEAISLEDLCERLKNW